MTLTGSLLIAILALITDIVLGFIEKLFTIRKATLKSKRKYGLVVIVTTCAVLIISMISGNLNQTVTLNIATKPMTEQYIIGAMLKEMIEQDTDIKVKITQGVGGGTSNIQPGMVSGEFDLYPEYTSTGWNTVLKHEGFYNETMYEQLVKEYQEKYHGRSARPSDRRKYTCRGRCIFRCFANTQAYQAQQERRTAGRQWVQHR